MQLRRMLTETPLARQHERVMQGRGRRKHTPIAWNAFDRARWPGAALRLALDAQQKLAMGEYLAVDLFARVASAVAIHGAPIDLVAAAAAIPSDEIRHADFTLRMAALMAGKNVVVPVKKELLASRYSTSRMTQEELDDLMIEVPAIGETLACALLKACADGATDPTVKALYANIVRDEVHHARFGWYYLAWRAPQWTQAERQRVADRMGAHVVEIERRFWKGRDAPASERKSARALGVLDSPAQRIVVRRIMEDEIVPALDAVGLGASHAWKVRRRGKA
jgi:1,2-phenylacetyl-CoA epoxidase catalytic subunit